MIFLQFFNWSVMHEFNCEFENECERENKF